MDNVDPVTIAPFALRGLKTGDSFNLSLPGRKLHLMIVRVLNKDGDDRSLRGRLFGREGGSIWIKWRGHVFSGMILIPGQNLAYVIDGSDEGTLSAREYPLSSKLCVMPADGHRAEVGQPVIFGLPRPTNRMFTASSNTGTIGITAVPALQSRPGTPRVIYLDFDGEVVNDVTWSESTINAAAARLGESDIYASWQRVVADFDSFDVNITTVRSDFDNAPVNSRTHVIITATDDAAPGAGGIAYLDSFTDAYSRYCWVFIDDQAKDCAEVISHEVGHTLNLDHDGRTNPVEEYYEGHGTGNTGWAPIMGVGYYQELVQWSKGDYPNANRIFEDDLQIIGEKLPYLADDHGNAISNATAAFGLSVSGRIERTTDVDVFRLELTNATYTIELQPADYSNLDTLLEIMSSSGSIIATANPPGEIFATATFTLAAPQAVYARVRGTGKAANGDDYGYPAYSSLGSYVLTGFANQQQPPSPPFIISVRIISGSQLEIAWQDVPGASNYELYRNGVLILSANVTQFVDRNLAPGSSYSYQIKSGNSFGTSELSGSASATTPAADEFVMDGNADFSGYLVSNPGMVIYAAVRSNRLYVSTWSPGDNGAGGSDHHILVSDVLLPSATTPNPWSKSGTMAIPGNKPFLAGESDSVFAGWFNTSGATSLFKGNINSIQLEGSIDLIANFGAIPETIYLAAIAFDTSDGGGINAQAPTGNGNDMLEPAEFLAVTVKAISDRALNGTFDILAPERDFGFTTVTVDDFNRPQLGGLAIPGTTFILHRGTNLSIASETWPAVATNTSPAGSFFLTVTDPAPNLDGAAFYRLRLP